MSTGELVGMSADELVTYLRGAGVELAAKGDRLHCNAPRGTLTPELRAKLAEHKGEVLALLRGGAGAARPAAPDALRPVAHGGEPPLSFAQQRMWFLDQLEPANPFYNIPEAVRITNALSVAALGQTLGEIVRRHEVLRASFPAADGSPRQVIAEPRGVRLLLADLTRLPEAARERGARALALREARRPFDLSRGPLLRAALLRLGPQEHVLLLTMHHIVSDGWSTGVLVGEFMALYEAFAAGRPSPLRELKVQYGDFAHWQQRWLQGEVLDRQLAYWRGKLEGAASVLDLPTDFPRPAFESHRGAGESITLPVELSRALRALSRRERVTPFATLLCAFQCLLQRYTGQTDVCVGTPVAGRNHAETEGLIGLFTNTLVMRGDLSGDPEFRELLARTREFVVGAYAHQDLPFERLVEELQPRRELNRHPLFQVMFLLQNTPVEPRAATGIRIEPLDLGSARSLFDLMLTVTEAADGLTVSLEYSTDLFEAATAARLLRHLRTLLTAAVADPTLRLHELPLLGEGERRELLVELNDTAADYDRDATIHQLFARQAARTPSAVALVSGDEHLTYAELEARSNRLARHLRALGVGAESRVAVFTERGVGMVVALLGTLKAGAAYVPVDPAYPAERVAYMLEDSGAGVVITQGGLSLPPPPSGRGPHVVRLDDDADRLAAHEPTPPDPHATPANLAYVIYTSGSTGRPKGVQIPHGAAVNLLSTMKQRAGLTPDDTLLAVTTLSFDIAALELFLPLVNGAKVLLADRETVADGARLARLLESGGATVMQATPATWRLLLEAGWTESPGLKMLCGGEALPPALAEKLAGRGRGLWNLYGPTETTIWSAGYEVPPGAPIYLGRPLANTRFYLLGREGEPVPPGVAGELHIGGDGLARGYLNQPGRTAVQFVPDAFSGTAGARLYRTGDLARYVPGGDLQFLGRADGQVKVRGYRIEPGEIEAALRTAEGVAEAVVIVKDDEAGHRRLVAYVVGQDGAEAPPPAELRRLLTGRLPPYMVPSLFVALDRLPLTPNGKLDRRALPEPARAPAGESLVAPRNPAEELIADIWAGVLSVEGVGVHDNFFELGGHSLLATKLLARVRQFFRVEIPLRDFFMTPTVEGLAARVESARRDAPDGDAAPVVPAPRDGKIPLSFAQQRLWFLDRLAPGGAAYNVPVAVRLSGPLNHAALAQALSEVVRRHEALRTRFAAEVGEPEQVIEEAARPSWVYADLRGVPGAARPALVRRLARGETRRSFDLARAPLLRVTLLREGEAEHALLLTMHHIVSDGWSTGVLVGEVSALYAAYTEGRPSPLAELPIQYADYVAWQRGHLQGETLERHLAFWREQLAGAPPLLELPTDRPRPPVQTFRGAVESFALPAEESGRLKAFGRREGATLFMTLLTVFNVLLQRYTRQDDIVVGTNVAKRSMPEIENLIGFFVDNLVLRADLSGNPSLAQLLGRVRRVCLDAYAHQEVPFDKITGELRPERNLSYNPIFQVLFVLQNNPVPRLNVPGLSVSRMEYEGDAVQFDLAVDVFDTEHGLLFKLRYNTDLFDGRTAARFMSHFRALLEGAAADPEQPIAALKMGVEEEQRDLIAAFNDGFD